MANNNQEVKPLTAAQVEEQRRLAEQREAQQQQQQRGQSITVDNQQVSPPPSSSPQQKTTTTGGGGRSNKINKLVLETQFVKVEISDPNILDELNTEEKYPDQLNFERLECNINIHGGRISLTTDDKMGKSKEILSGIAKKEMENIKTWKIE